MGKVICFANQKGGVGKTTLTYTFTNLLTSLDKKVLIIDFDPQASQTDLYDIDWARVGPANDIVKIATNEEVLPISLNDKLDIIVSHSGLNELLERDIKYKEFMLKKFIDKVRENYDYILIDTTPALGILLNNSIIASDVVVVPIETSFLAEKATIPFLENLEDILSFPNMEIDALYFIPNKFKHNQVDDRNIKKSITDNVVEYINLEFSNISSNVSTIDVLEAIPDRVIFKTAVTELKGVQELVKDSDISNKKVLILLENILQRITNG